MHFIERPSEMSNVVGLELSQVSQERGREARWLQFGWTKYAQCRLLLPKAKRLKLRFTKKDG